MRGGVNCKSLIPSPHSLSLYIPHSIPLSKSLPPSCHLLSSPPAPRPFVISTISLYPYPPLTHPDLPIGCACMQSYGRSSSVL